MANPVEDSVDRTFLTWMIVVSVVTVWLVPLTSSFWLDETGTYWIISDGFGEAWSRSLHFQTQTPLYFIFAWLVEQLAGGSEWLLRLPSVLAMGCAAVGVKRLGDALFAPEVGWWSVTVFVPLPIVASTAGEARPYAFGVAFLVWSTLALVRWRRGAGWSTLGIYVLLFALAVSMQPLFVIVLAAHVAFMAVETSGSGERRSFVVALLCTTLLLLPSAVAAAATLGTPSQLSAPAPTDVEALGIALAPPALIVALLVAVALGLGKGPGPRFREFPISSRTSTALVLAWAIVPGTLLWLVTALTPFSVFVPRYLSMAAPGLALAVGLLLVRFGDSSRRERAAAGLVAVLLAGAWHATGSQGWREALGATRQILGAHHGAVLIQTRFIESASQDYLEDEERRQWLLAPVAAYPVSGDLVPMPYAVDEFTEQYLASLRPALGGYERVVLVAGTPNSDLTVAVADELGSGFELELPPDCFDDVCLIVFTRQDPSGER